MVDRIISWLKKASWLAILLAVAGFALYAWQTWNLSHRLTTMILDESMYVYKGYLFAIGKYAPYEDYGPLTNHMPLAFMIPGWVQAWFGPGMGTARMFAFIVGLVMLAGVWMAFYRVGNFWWGTVGVWLFALNPAWQEVFAQGLTQGIVNMFIVWGLVFLIGKYRDTWQIILAAVLVTLAVLTRVNTLPILVLMLLYIFWEHGSRSGLIATLTALVVGVVVLAFYWPEVLKFLSGWVPEGMFSFVEPYRSPWSQQHVPADFSYFPVSDWWGQPASEQFHGIKAFYEAIKFSLIPWLTVAGALVFWPRRWDWRSDYHFQLSLFLLVTWVVSAAMHIWVAGSGTSCHFYCMAGYFTFFNLLGLLLLPAVFPYLRTNPSIFRQVIGVVLLLAIIIGAIYSTGLVSPGMNVNWWEKALLTPIPLITGGKLHIGETGPLLSLIEHITHLDYHFLVEVLPTHFYWLLPLLVMALIPLVRRIVLGPWNPYRMAVAPFAFILMVLLGAALGYTDIFYQKTANLACEDDVILTHEAVAAELQEIIEPGSSVYWELTSNMLLLYLPDVEIFPPQLNTGFNYLGNSQLGKSDLVYKFGYWNATLKQEWIKQADYLLIPSQHAETWQPMTDSGEFDIVGLTAPYETCRAKDTQVMVLVRTETP